MNREEFIKLVSREQESLKRFLLALCCGNREEANDIAQETLVKAYLSVSHYQDEGKFNAWLYKIAHNTFLDRKKEQRDWDTLDEAISTPDLSLAADRSFAYQDLYAAIASLPAKERTSILLYYLKGYSIKEISAIIDVSVDAVKKQLSRGREQLKLKIKRE